MADLSKIRLNGTNYNLKDGLVRETLLTPSSENIDKVWKTVGLSSMTVSDIVAQTTINLTGTGNHVSILYWPEEDEEYIISFDLYNGDTLIETVNETLISSDDIDVVFGFGEGYNFILTDKNDNSVFLDYMKESQGSPYKLVNFHVYQEIPITIPDTGWYNDQQIYKVNVTYDENNDIYSSDKTAAEIYNAYNTLKQIPIVYFGDNIFINTTISEGKAFYNHQWINYYEAEFYRLTTNGNQQLLQKMNINYMVGPAGNRIYYSEYNISNFSGEYDDLYNKPTIPTAISDLTNDSNFMIKGTDYVTAGQLEGSTLGTKATAEGYNTIAEGQYSHAEGYNTIAKGDYSHAEGYYTTTENNSTSIRAAHAEGAYTLAEGGGSHAEGIGTGTPYFYLSDGSASKGSHSEGCFSSSTEIDISGNANVTTYNCNYGSVVNLTEERINQLVMVSTGTGQFFGPRVLKSIDTANNTITVDKTFNADNAISGRLCLCTTANRAGAHAEGSGTYSSQLYGHSEGNLTIAKLISHAEGSHTIANFYSHSEGNYTKAVGYYSHAEGNNTIAQKQSQHVFGEYNIEDTYGGSSTSKGRYIEIVGNGTADNTRSNARTLDWSGNEVLTGKLTVGADPTANMDVATKQYVDTAITTAVSDINSFNVSIVQSLPTEDIDIHTIYFISNSSSGNNTYNEYMYINNSWELIGSTAIDLTPYALSSSLATVATSGSYNDLTNKPTIPAAQVQSDWNATTGMGVILNKPSIPTDISNLTDTNNIIPEDKIYPVNVTLTSTTAGTSDKSHAEINTAVIRGKIPFVYITYGTIKMVAPLARVESNYSVFVYEDQTVTDHMNYANLQIVGTTVTITWRDKYITSSDLPTIPTATSDLTNDSGFITSADIPAAITIEDDPIFMASPAYGITSSDIDAWNAKSDFTGSYTDLTNKPTIPAAQVQSDWNATSGMGVILNKPTNVSAFTNDAGYLTSYTETDPTVPSWAKESTKPSYTFSELTTTPTTISGYGITDAYTKTEVDGKVSGVLHYKGTKATVSALPSSGNSIGDTWHVTADGSEHAWDGSTWQELGTAVDLSGYVPTTTTVNGKALSSNISLTASDVSALPSNTTYVSSFNGSTGAITYTAPVTSVNGQTGAVTTQNTTYSLSMSGNRITLTPSSGTATYVDLPVYNGGVST